MKTAETPAGIFTINKVKIPSAYTCAAEQNRIYQRKSYADHYYGSGSIIWRSDIVPPESVKSCMNPEKNYKSIHWKIEILLGEKKYFFYGSL